MYINQFSRSVVSHSLWPHESQHTRPPCPSPSPGVHSDSRPLSPWCQPAISSSVIQSWIFIVRTDAKAPILWPPDVKNWLIGKDLGAGKDWRQEEKAMTEDEMAGWHHKLDEHESEWTLGVGDGQGGLVCCDSWGHKESDTTELLNWTNQTELIIHIVVCIC